MPTTTTSAPVIENNYWANFDSLVSGNGSVLNPFTYNQIRNYFNPDLGDACNVTPANGDIINCEGTINLIDIDTVFSIKININGNILVKVKDLNTKPWMVETIDNIYSEINMIKNVEEYGITNLEIRDFVICDSSVITTTTTTTTTTPEPLVSSYFGFGLDVVNGVSDPKLYCSADLAAWSACGTLPAGTLRVVYGNGVLVAYVLINSYNGPHDLYYSIDIGATWTQIVNAAPRHMVGLDFVNGYFLSFNTYDSTVWFSSDGINWNYTNSLSGTTPVAVKFFYFKGAFCCIASPINRCYFNTGTLVQGSNWTTTKIVEDNYFIASDETVAVSDTYIVAITSDHKVYYSTDGIAWTHWRDVLYAVFHDGNSFYFDEAGQDSGDNPYEDSIVMPDNNMTASLNPAGFVAGPNIIKNGYYYGINVHLSNFDIHYDFPYNVVKKKHAIDDEFGFGNSTGIPSTMQLKQLLG